MQNPTIKIKDRFFRFIDETHVHSLPSEDTEGSGMTALHVQQLNDDVREIVKEWIQTLR